MLYITTVHYPDYTRIRPFFEQPQPDCVFQDFIGSYIGGNWYLFQIIEVLNDEVWVEPITKKQHIVYKDMYITWDESYAMAYNLMNNIKEDL